MDTSGRPEPFSARAALRWALLLLGLWFTLSEWASNKESEPDEVPVTESTIQVGEFGLAADLRPLRVGPGGGFLVDLRDESGQPRANEIERVELAGRTLNSTELIDGRRMFQVPEDMKLGRQQVQVHLRNQSAALGAGLEVRSANQRKILRNIVGGLALLLYGLRILTKGLRRVASRRLQLGVERLTHHRVGAMAVGLLLGPMAQTGASAVGVVNGFVESRLIRPVAALWFLWGSLISLSAAAALLPFVSFREALVFVGVGVAWLMLARSRRQRAVAQVLLGGGLLFHGVHLTRIGFASLVSTPELLSYASFLQTDTVSGWLICWLTGLVLAFVFQGPSALVLLVLGLLEALGLVGVPSALAILAGAFAGTPLSALALSWPFGRKERRVIGLVTALSFLASLLLLLLQPVLLVLLDPMIEGDPNLAIWGKKQVLPYAASHLVATHLAALGALAVVSGMFSWLPRWIKDDRGVDRRDANLWFEQWLHLKASAPGEDAPSFQREILRVLAEVKAALPEALGMMTDGNRELGSLLESRVAAIREASSAVMAPLREDAQRRALDVPGQYLRSTALTLFHLEHAVESLRRMADSFIERGERMRETDVDTLRRITSLLVESIDEVVESIREQVEIDLESIQSREIQINGIELEHRRRTVGHDQKLSIRGEALTAELVSGLENIGNQLYRLVQSLDGVALSEAGSL